MSSVNAAPCDVCNGLLKDDHDRRLALDVTPDELDQSVKAGKCPLCGVLSAAIQQFGEATWKDDPPGSWDERIARIYAYGLSGPHDTLSIEVYYKSGGPRRTFELFYPKSGSTKGVLLPGVQERPSLSTDPLSETGLGWASTALRSCLEDHADCPSENSAAPPKRVLEITQPPSGDINVLLVSDVTDSVRYAALSHCWGTQPSAITTKATIKRNSRGIPWKQLPATFQDAITFSMAIGLRYIWIDALCIVQDDEVDWQVQSSLMADIYQNAYLTLAATHSTSGSIGCFTAGRCGKILVGEQEVTLPDSLRRWHGVRLREKVQHWTAPMGRASAKTHPVLSRGWIFQERILSPRVLHFCAEEMVWECKSTTQCECGGLPPSTGLGPREIFGDITATPTADDEANTDTILLALRSLQLESQSNRTDRPHSLESGADWASRSIQNIFRTFRGQPPKPRPLGMSISAATLQPSSRPQRRRQSRETTLSDTITGRITNSPRLTTYSETSWETRCWPDQPVASRLWQKLVEQYSPLLLSKETDRLPALSGITSRVEPHLGGYRAGLWSTTLAPDLLWRTTQLKSGSHMVAQGPSWSWTAVNGGVQYWDDLRVDIDMTEVESWTRRRPLFKSCFVNPIGKNRFGQVAPGGEIVIQGSLLRARFRYVWTRQDHGSTTRTLDYFRYEVHLDGLEIGMYADHVCMESGPHHISDYEEVWLLLIHPDVCLVLADTLADGSKFPTYRRIGIVRQPQAFTREYVSAVDWLAGSVEKTIRII
ncbi:heterokaryon incompatibility protein-domain-containing protein [Immersiella caudata]|uniref:Heterokaryon incompatibility protein-domain-containing protein n=1 Tax=Immersiella caudata TaxID=314043 RepID=A0AA39WLL8_9PEZI|nr:heterokaryon incompatibility protein-domain-containing protein [Immersiella caudata]